MHTQAKMHAHKSPEKTVSLHLRLILSLRASLANEWQTTPAQNQSAETGSWHCSCFFFCLSVSILGFQGNLCQNISWTWAKRTDFSEHTQQGIVFAKSLEKSQNKWIIHPSIIRRKTKQQTHGKGESDFPSYIRTIQCSNFNNKKITGHTKNKKTRLIQWKRINWQTILAEAFLEKGIRASRVA